MAAAKGFRTESGAQWALLLGRLQEATESDNPKVSVSAPSTHPLGISCEISGFALSSFWAQDARTSGQRKGICVLEGLLGTSGQH